MSKVRNNPVSILENLRNELVDVTKKLDNHIESDSLDNNELDVAIDYLNATIRKLDHAVEALLESRN